MLTGLIELYRPLWATLGGSIAPSPRVDDDGTPAVGWDTFLCNQYGALPTLPAHAAATPWEGLGSIVRAFPDVLDERNPDHLMRLGKLRHALVVANVIRPARELEAYPRSAREHKL